MKKERNSRYCHSKEYDTYSYTDTRYYGLWVHGQGEKLQVRLDPKRFQKVTYHTFSPEQLAVMNKRSSHYFHPPKPLYESYHCNEFCDTIKEMREKWENHFKPLIETARERIPKPRELTAGDCGLLMCGIMDPDEAQTWANFENLTNSMDYHSECVDIVVSLYAQFLHLFASQIEAVTVRVLSDEKAVTDKFDRNSLYGTAVGKEKAVEELPSFRYYDKLYCVWNFIKHNSTSTFKKLHERYPEALLSGTYRQGDLAIQYLNISDQLILELMEGCSAFFREYCELVFSESYAEAQWNYGRYFTSIVYDEIETYTNPLGLPWYL